MTARRGERVPFHPFQTATGQEKKYIRFTASMNESAAWRDLSALARSMYHDMLFQYSAYPDNAIKQEFPKESGERLTRLFFYNEELARRSGMYGRTNGGKFAFNRRTFRRGRDELIRHGFIRVYEGGKGKGQKYVYEFVDSWKQWNSKPP